MERASYNYRRRVAEQRRRIAKMKRVQRFVKKVIVPIIILIAVFLFVKGTIVHIAQSNAPEAATHIEVREVTPESITTSSDVDTKMYIAMSDEDKERFATLVYLEAGGESYECQKAVASVVINRMQLQNASFDEIVYEENQFETAENLPYYSPSESTRKAVDYVLTHGPSIPSYVTYFRADHYHDWSEYLIPYTCIDNTYFSYDYRLAEEG